MTIMKEVEAIDENNPGVIFLRKILEDLEENVKGEVTGIYKYTEDSIKISVNFSEIPDKKFSYTVWNVSREIINGTTAVDISSNIRYNMRRYIYGMIFKKGDKNGNRAVSAPNECIGENA